MAAPPGTPGHVFGVMKGDRRFFLPDDDQKLRQLKTSFPTMSWFEIAERMPGFTARQVRERWCNYLSPDLKKDDWTSEEDAELLRLYGEIGPHWGLIGNFMQNRSGPDIKNRYHVIHHGRRKRKRSPGRAAAKAKAKPNTPQPAQSGVKKIVVPDDSHTKETPRPPHSTTEFSIKNILAQ
jgi:myb proto-oncogene protein/Myb-like DNA-binding protein BAS1